MFDTDQIIAIVFGILKVLTDVGNLWQAHISAKSQSKPRCISRAVELVCTAASWMDESVSNLVEQTPYYSWSFS